jgi:calmodulin-regulated spectrin-associated protein
MVHLIAVQALARKGVFVTEPADCALTETVLIQTSPLRMSAHLAVIEALMMLFVRELAPPARVLAAVRRYSKTEDAPAHSEEALLFWVNQSCQAVRYKDRVIDFVWTDFNVDVIVTALAVL